MRPSASRLTGDRPRESTDTIGDISEDDGVKMLSIQVDLRNRGLHGEFLAISAQSANGAGIAQLPVGYACLAKASHVPGMLSPKSRWNKAFERAAYSLARRAPKDLLCSSIEQNDPLIGIHADDRIHGRLQDALNLLAAFAKSLFGLEPLDEPMPRLHLAGTWTKITCRCSLSPRVFPGLVYDCAAPWAPSTS